MTEAPITAVLTGVLAGMLVILSGVVSFRRIATKTSLGQGTDELLQRLIRIQGNFVEYVPLALIALYFVETGGAAERAVCIIGGLLVAGRVIHAVSMLVKFTLGRSLGMILTYASLISSAVFLLTRA